MKNIIRLIIILLAFSSSPFAENSELEHDKPEKDKVENESNNDEQLKDLVKFIEEHVSPAQPKIENTHDIHEGDSETIVLTRRIYQLETFYRISPYIGIFLAIITLIIIKKKKVTRESS